MPQNEQPLQETFGAAIPALSDYCRPQFFRVLGSPFREAYWTILARAYDRKFLAIAIALTRGEAIDLAEDTIRHSNELGFDPARILSEEGVALSDLEDDMPSSSPYRDAGRRLIRVLMDAGWIYFQTYPDQRFPILEFTLHGQRQVSHMLREMRGERLPLRSFTDRLYDLVGNRCSGMRAVPGRLRQLRDVVAQLNERIYELLGGIKAQSESVIARARTIREILSDLLGDFERRVGYEYFLLKHKEGPWKLGSQIRQAVYDLREDPYWLDREARWYAEQSEDGDFELATQRVLDDLSWLARVLDNLARAIDLLDRRYARYVSLARRRIEAQLRQSHTVADGLRYLLESAASGRVGIEQVSVARAVSLGPVGFSFDRQRRHSTVRTVVATVPDLSEHEARAHRQHMDDAIPLVDIRRWLGAVDGAATSKTVDTLPLTARQDYLCHIFAAVYAAEARSGIRFEVATCGDVYRGGCRHPDICKICYRHANGFTVPRGTFTVLAGTA